MYIQRVLITICSLAILILPGLGLAGIRPSWIKGTLFTLDEEIFQTVSAPNKWGYIVSEFPGSSFGRFPFLSDNGLTFSIDVRVSLRKVKAMSTDEAEALFCDLYQDVLEKLNALKDLRPLLASFPLNPDSCWLFVSFEDDLGKTVLPPSLADVILNNGKLIFRIFEPDSKSYSSYKTISVRDARDVPYLRKFYQTQCPRAKAATPPRGFQFSSLSWRYESSFSKEKIRELRDLCSQTDLNLTAVGAVVGRSFSDSRPVEFALHGSQQLNLKESQHLATTCLRHMLSYIKSNQSYKEILEAQAPYRKNSCNFSEPASNQIAFRINFWDENIDRPVAPYIAEIRLLDDKLSYFTADENQRLVLVFEETVKDNLQEMP